MFRQLPDRRLVWWEGGENERHSEFSIGIQDFLSHSFGFRQQVFISTNAQPTTNRKNFYFCAFRVWVRWNCKMRKRDAEKNSFLKQQAAEFGIKAMRRRRRVRVRKLGGFFVLCAMMRSRVRGDKNYKMENFFLRYKKF